MNSSLKKSIVLKQQIITMSMASGLLMMVAVVLSIQPEPVEQPQLISTAIVVTVVGIAGHFFLPQLLVRKNLESIARQRVSQPNVELDPQHETQLLATYDIKSLIEVAMLEAPGTTGVVLYYLEGAFPYLVLGIMMAILILSRFPTESRLENTIATWREELLGHS